MGKSLEVPQGSTSNDYPKCMFPGEGKYDKLLLITELSSRTVKFDILPGKPYLVVKYQT